MKPAHLLALGAAALASACTPMQWVKEGGDAAQLEADAAYCQREAWREASFQAWSFQPSHPVLLRDGAGRPFVVWQHSPFGDPFGHQLMEESRLANFCMRSKGWRLEPIPEAKSP